MHLVIHGRRRQYRVASAVPDDKQPRPQTICNRVSARQYVEPTSSVQRVGALPHRDAKGRT